MKLTLKSAAAFSAAVLLLFAPSVARAETLALDFQPDGSTVAPGYQAFVAVNQTLPTGGTDYAAFGSTVTVSLTPANLPDGNLDFRAVTRNGAADQLTNDWIGVDTRNGGVDVSLAVSVAGLPAGLYSWLSTHHDGGTVVAPIVSGGNLSGMPDFSFTDADGVASGTMNLSSERDLDPIATFARTFRSDGINPISFQMVMDNGQGDVPANALFAYINGVEITSIPEPTTLFLSGLGIAALLVTRARRD